MRRLLALYKIWRVGVWPWVVAIFLHPTIVALAVLAAGAGSTVFASFDPMGLAIIPLLWLGALPFGPLAEELGWRGWLQPRLQARMTPLKTSLVIGFVWTFWHTPMFGFPGAAIPSALDVNAQSILIYLAFLVAMSILFTAMWNHTRGSVLLAIVFHTTFNTSEAMVYRPFEVPTEAQDPVIYFWTVGLTWVAAILCIATGRLSPRSAPADSAPRTS